MLTTVLLILFIVITDYMKKDGIRLVKLGKSHGVFVILLAKMFFWFSIVEMVFFWYKPALIYILPLVLCAFLYYVYADRKILAQGIAGRPTLKFSPKKQPENPDSLAELTIEPHIENEPLQEPSKN